MVDTATDQARADMTDGEAPTADEALASWLAMARDAHTESSNWFDVSLRPAIEKAIAHFQNRHASGSKYYTEQYRLRSKGFRPKTRSTIRRNEAAASVAFFATADCVSITAQNDSDQNQRLSAAITSELVNYRLEETIPWFQTLIGAYQNAQTVGVCISHNGWEFEEAVGDMPLLDERGRPVLNEDGTLALTEVRDVLADKPVISLVAVENFRISPASDWTDPIGTSPYVIEMIPMFIGDVIGRMDRGHWFPYTDGQIKTAAQSQYDSIRAARDGTKRQDAADLSHANQAFDTVFVHRNIVRKDGVDWLFWTLGTSHMLTDPVPLRQEYRHLRHRERPYTMGYCVLEAHKPMPPGLSELGAGLQEAANEIGNQRRDNVSLAMNRRYFARRGADVDYRSLTRNVPGSVTLVSDINSDVRSEAPPDVTASSYAEQDRINLDFDELAGSFSPGSVQSNRQLNETVGGMNLISNDANTMSEYQLRVFAETWVQPTLKQLVRLEQYNETDQMILAIAGQRAKAFETFGVSEITDAMLRHNLTVRVNVGFGSTNPRERIDRLAIGLGTIGKFRPDMMMQLDGEQVATEVLGALGYKGTERFFPGLKRGVDPMVAQLQQQVQQLQQIIATKQIENQGRLQVEDRRQKGAIEVQTLRGEQEFAIAKLEAAIKAIDRQISESKTIIDAERLKNERLALVNQLQQARWDRSNAGVIARDDFGRIPQHVG